jgi:hypothetical protein
MSPDPIVDKLNEVILAVAKVETKIEVLANNITANNTSLVNVMTNNNTTLVTTIANYIKSNYDAKTATDANRKWLIVLAVSIVALTTTIVFKLFM